MRQTGFGTGMNDVENGLLSSIVRELAQITPLLKGLRVADTMQRIEHH